MLKVKLPKFIKSNRVATELTACFGIILVVFAILNSCIFLALFHNQNMLVSRSDLEERTTAAAHALAPHMANDSNKELDTYMAFLSQSSINSFLIYDSQGNILKQSNTFLDDAQNYNPLQGIIDLTLGSTAATGVSVKTTYDTYNNVYIITCGAKIYHPETNQSLGTIVYYNPITSINSVLNNGFILMCISFIVALTLGLVISTIFAVYWTKPLGVLKETAERLANGDYNAKTQIFQNDEIGDLAVTIDILANQLNYAKNQRDKLNQMRDDFVANVSHELKTPVTVIKGSLEALADGIITDEEMTQEYYQQMLIETRCLERLISDLLDLSKLQNSDFKIHMESLTLKNIIDDVLRSARRIVQEKNVNLDYSTENPVYPILGDYGRLRQMIMNVVANAIKFSENGQTVTIKMIGNQLSVNNCSKGIAPEDLPHIFDKFYKSPSEDNKDGSGLGLAIAKQIASRHNIEITVTNNIIDGTTFTFIFPQV